MKKIALILALLMVFTMMGCDVSNNNAETTTETQTEAKTDGTQETKTDAEIEDNTESQTQTQTETQSETETVTETETETETEVVTETETQTETETVTDTDTETETKSETESDQQANGEGSVPYDDYYMFTFSSPERLDLALKNDSKGFDIRSNRNDCSKMFNDMIDRFEKSEITLKYPVLDGYEKDFLTRDVLLFSSEAFGMPWIWYRNWYDNKIMVVQISYLSEKLVEYSKDHSVWDVVRYVSPATSSLEEMRENEGTKSVTEKTVATKHGESDVVLVEKSSGNRNYLTFIVDNMMVRIFGSPDEVNFDLLTKLNFIEIDSASDKTTYPSEIDEIDFFGMTYGEVKAIMGAEGTDIGSGAIIMQWELDDGRTLRIWLNKNANHPNDLDRCVVTGYRIE